MGSNLRILRNPLRSTISRIIEIDVMKTIFFMHFLLIHYGLCSEQANIERQNVDYAC